MRVLLAVSGGIDSIYMAIRRQALFPGASFAIAHCNFGLRGAESDGDEAFVRSWCLNEGVECFVKRFDTRAYSLEHSVSIEMAARELRYEWFSELCLKQSFDAVAVAHNANDNAETLLLNLVRGTGSRGIRGMSKESENWGKMSCFGTDSQASESSIEQLPHKARLLRPLLGISRAQIRSWMESEGHSWREDSTNAVSDCKRNLIRNDIFPLLKSLNPAVVSTLNADMQRFAQVDDIAEDYFCEHRAAVCTESGDIEIEPLLALKHWKYVLWRLLEDSGIAAEEFASLVSCLECGRQIAGKSFGPVMGASGRLVFASECKEEFDIQVIARSELGSLVQPKGRIVMDADKLELPLKVRNWRDGDWMQPLGMRGRKKLSDMMTALRWSRRQKAAARVVELEGSHIAALLCERIDESVKITDSTQRVVVVEIITPRSQ